MKKKPPLNYDLYTFIAIAFCAVIFFPTIVPHLKGLSFTDLFGVITGGVALLLTIYQMYNGIVKDRTEDLEDDIEHARKLFTEQINEGNDLCRERFDNQQRTLKYLTERVNDLIIDFRTHEKLFGHPEITDSVAVIEEELTLNRAEKQVKNQSLEILERLRNLESQQCLVLLQGGKNPAQLTEEIS